MRPARVATNGLRPFRILTMVRRRHALAYPCAASRVAQAKNKAPGRAHHIWCGECEKWSFAIHTPNKSESSTATDQVALQPRVCDGRSPGQGCKLWLIPEIFPCPKPLSSRHSEWTDPESCDNRVAQGGASACFPGAQKQEMSSLNPPPRAGETVAALPVNASPCQAPIVKEHRLLTATGEVGELWNTRHSFTTLCGVALARGNYCESALHR